MSLEAQLGPIHYPASNIELEGARLAVLQKALSMRRGKLRAHHSGHMNDVLHVRTNDDEEILKIPHEDTIYQDGADRLGALHREHTALAILDRKTGSSLGGIRAPKIYGYQTSPVDTLVTEMLPGMIAMQYDAYAKREKKAFGDNEKERFGRQLGSFVLRQTTAVDPDLFLYILNLDKSNWSYAHRLPEMTINGYYDLEPGRYFSHASSTERPTSTWEHRISTMVQGWSNPDYPETSALFDRLCSQWRSLRADSYGEPRFIHGDLHYGNVMVNQEFELTGVFDYGEAGIGQGSDAFAQELSTSSLMDNDIVRKACMDALGDEAPSAEAIDLWWSLKLGYTIPAWLDRGKRGFMNPRVLADFSLRHPEVSKELEYRLAH